MNRKILIALMTLFSFSFVNAQLDLPRLSPNASVSQTIGYTNITINYCRPGVKGRTIWGGLVPYGKVWRTGANEATEIHFTTDVKLNGNPVPAGIYSIFTIPSEKDWMVIINKEYGMNGLNYNEAEDFLRFKVVSQEGTFTERMLFTFHGLTDSSVTVQLNWEKLQIAFDVEIDFRNQVFNKIMEAMANAKPGEYQVYVASANYAADNNMSLKDALKWADKAIAIEKNFDTYYARAYVLYKMKNYLEALRAIDKCREAGSRDKNYETFVSRVDLLESRINSEMK